MSDDGLADGGSPPGASTPWPVPMAAALDGPAGAPVLVLADSLGTSTAVWDRQVAALGAEFRLLRFELPGHGGASAWPGPYTIGQLGAGLLALLDDLGVDRAGYAGISVGGMIGMWLASQAPERIAALGLVCTSAHLPPAEGWRDRAARVRLEGMSSISEQVIARWFTASFADREPAVVSSVRATLEQTDPEGYAGCCEAIAEMDQLDDLRAVTAPTLVIAGAEDPATPPEHGAAIAERIAGARLQVLPDAAHLAAVSSPREVTAELLGHFRQAAAADQIWRSER
jgi:3-oxoadipate enol-lactonase